MAPLCVEDLRVKRLKCKGWSSKAAERSSHILAKSTRDQYSYYLDKLIKFCDDNHYNFPPSEPVFADFLCFVSSISQRPKSILTSACAALGWFYCASGEENICLSVDISNLKQAIIKTGSSLHRKRSNVIPSDKLYDMFLSWGSNENLAIDMLRLKCVVLMALYYMARPSDLAPRGEIFDPSSDSYVSCALTTDQVKFLDNGGCEVIFHGIKNDTDRSGFVCTIPSHDDPLLNLQDCLKCYIKRSRPVSCTNLPLFLHLRQPVGLKSASIAGILKKGLILAGLSDFQPRDFRPTAATKAVQAGENVDCYTTSFLGGFYFSLLISLLMIVYYILLCY